MALNLSVMKSPSGVTLTSPQKAFGEEGGTIGRGDGNDWVLGDPDRFLSSRHCSLSYQGGQYYLTDTSTNGTFINGAPEPIGKGGTIPINDGDSIELGDYQFRAELQADVAMPSNPFGAAPEPPSALEPMADDPFGSPASLEDPFASSDFAVGSSVSLDPDPVNVDPLAALDKRGGGSPFPSHTPAPSEPSLNVDPLGGLGNDGSLDDLFGNSTPGQDVFSQSSSMGDEMGAVNQSMDWPEAKSDSMIPDDWDDDLMGGTGGLGDDFAAPTPPAQPRPQLDVSAAHRSIPLTEPPKHAQHSADRALLSERKPEPVEPFKARPKAQPARSRAEAKPQPRRQMTESVGEALLEGMGLGGRDFSPEDAEHIHQVVGELIPVIITGMMQVLRSRASIKNEFRMNVTTIQPVENNPLKFSANAQEAIENMFVRDSAAYMKPKVAFKEGFDGISEHQVAIIAGIRAAFKSMMDRFNPEQLERQFDKQNKGVVLPGMQKSKYWNSYSDHYNGFIDNMENTFQYLFGDEFVQAYEDQLRRLSFERKQKQQLDD